MKKGLWQWMQGWCYNEDVFRFADELGPAKVIHVYEPSVGLKAVLVVDNVARGPAIGGLRIAPDVSTEECFRLARAMTLKNAAADLPHGGGKSVIEGANIPITEAAEKHLHEKGVLYVPDFIANAAQSKKPVIYQRGDRQVRRVL